MGLASSVGTLGVARILISTDDHRAVLAAPSLTGLVRDVPGRNHQTMRAVSEREYPERVDRRWGFAPGTS